MNSNILLFFFISISTIFFTATSNDTSPKDAYLNFEAAAFAYLKAHEEEKSLYDAVRVLQKQADNWHKLYPEHPEARRFANLLTDMPNLSENLEIIRKEFQQHKILND